VGRRPAAADRGRWWLAVPDRGRKEDGGAVRWGAKLSDRHARAAGRLELVSCFSDSWRATTIRASLISQLARSNSWLQLLMEGQGRSDSQPFSTLRQKG
jgi:hypothetical protein